MSADFARAPNSSFCLLDNAGPPPEARIRTESGDSREPPLLDTRPPKPKSKAKGTKMCSAKAFARTKTVSTPAELNLMKQKSVVSSRIFENVPRPAAMTDLLPTAKELSAFAPEPETSEERAELLDANLILKEVVRTLHERYQAEQVRLRHKSGREKQRKRNRRCGRWSD